MLDYNVGTTVDINPMTDIEVLDVLKKVKDGTIPSVIGHPDLASILGVPCNRVSVRLNPKDTLYVAQVIGGRLPAGTTVLPKGTEIKYLKVDIIG